MRILLSLMVGLAVVLLSQGISAQISTRPGKKAA